MSWRQRIMSDIIVLQRGHDLPASQRGVGTVPVIGSFGVTGTHDRAKCEGPGVAIGRSGASIGIATMVNEPFWPLNTCMFVTDFKGNDPGWVYRLLDWIDFKRFNSGSAQPSLNRNYLKNIPVLVPNIPEQRAIAELLGALDEKIAANTSLMSLIDELAGLLVCGNMSSATIPLASIATITMGSSPPGDTFNESSDGVVFYQGNRDFGLRYPVNRLWTTDPQRMALAGDTLVSVRAPVGQLNIANESICIGRGLAAVRSTTGLPNVLFHMLKQSPHVWASYQAEGTVFGSINKVQMDKLPVPDIKGEPVQLESDVASLESALASANRENLALVALRDLLLPQLMSGKLRVKDAEKQLEDVV